METWLDLPKPTDLSEREYVESFKQLVESPPWKLYKACVMQKVMATISGAARPGTSHKEHLCMLSHIAGLKESIEIAERITAEEMKDAPEGE